MAQTQATAMDGKGSLEKVAAWPARTKEYFGELRAEMRKVTWPNRKQVQATTLVVVVAVFAFAAYFFVVDQILTASVTRVYHALTR